MKIRIACILMTALFFAGAVRAQKGKWVTLFDGKSVDALRGYMMDSFPTQAWKVEDGALVAQTGVPNIDFLTRDTYTGRHRVQRYGRHPVGWLAV